MARARRENDPPVRQRNRVYVTQAKPGAEVNDPQAMALARNLNKMLLARGWRQRDLVEKVQAMLPPGRKFGRHLISTWLTGKHMPSPLNLDVVCKVLGVDMKELVPEGSAIMVGQPVSNMQLTVNGSTARILLDMEMPVDIALQVMQLAQKAKQAA